MTSIMQIIVVEIIIVAGGIPIMQDVVSNGNYSGTLALVLGLLPVFFALVALGIMAKMLD
jgi:uncharacterized membrane protein YphA (DoxX/SURF4 family)